MAIDGRRMVPCPGIELFVDSKNDLYILPIAGRPQLRVDAPLGQWVHRALRGRSMADMPLELGGEVAHILGWLEEETYVRRSEHVHDPALARWDRQVQWFAQETGDGPSRQRRLAGSTVLVLGVGGLGCVVADQLARAGVGKLVLVDDDRVEDANLPRQPLYGASDIGRYKVDAAADRFLLTCPGVQVERCAMRVGGPEDVASLLREHEPELVVCAADRPPIAIKTWVEEAASQYGCAVMHGGHRPPLVYAGPFFVPGLSCCYECFSRSRADDGAEQLEQELAIWRDRHPPDLPAVSWGDGAAASMLVAQAVQWLAGIAEPALLGRELELDLRTLHTRWVDGPDVPGCSRCDGSRHAARRTA